MSRDIDGANHGMDGADRNRNSFVNSVNCTDKPILYKPSFFPPRIIGALELPHANSRPSYASQPADRAFAYEATELHSLYCRGNASADDIRMALARDPTAASRQVTLKANRKVYDHVSGKIHLRQKNEPYKYPINLAICYKSSLEVIKMLMDAAPHVTHLPDGVEQETSLHVMLKYSPSFVQGIDTLLLHNPTNTSPADRQRNTLLHTACRCGASLEVLRHLIILYPDALHQRNLHNELPIQLAQRNSVLCTPEVAAYVWQQTNKGLGGSL